MDQNHKIVLVLIVHASHLITVKNAAYVHPFYTDLSVDYHYSTINPLQPPVQQKLAVTYFLCYLCTFRYFKSVPRETKRKLLRRTEKRKL